MLSYAMVGCAKDINPAITATPARPSKMSQEADAFKPATAAGIPVAITDEPVAYWKQASTSKPFGYRADPFALHPSERAFDISQNGERLFSQVGGFSVDFTPEVETVVVPVVEPQPYRRLAGVIVGDSVSALIDMGDNQGLKIITPGQKINGWTVASIDENKAVLRRSGNVLPREVIVRLESAPFGTGGSGGDQGQGGGNQPQGSSGGGPGKSGGPKSIGPAGLGG